VVAQKQRQFDKAIKYYQKALRIHEDAGDWHRAAYEHGQLATLSESQGSFSEAIDLSIKALLIFMKCRDQHWWAIAPFAPEADRDQSP
jgi:tetratricopeptide (TPR) repeat protein